MARRAFSKRFGVVLGLLGILGAATAARASGPEPLLSFFDASRLEGSWQPSTVTTVIQSHEGYLWVGTYHGLVRLDGVRAAVFDAINTPGLCNGLITALYEDPAGTLWIGHETGDLTRFHQGRFAPLHLGPQWPGGAIESINSDENGDLWLLNAGGLLFRVRDGHSAEAPGGASPSQKPCLIRAKGGQLWMAANGKVATVEHGALRPFFFDRAEGVFYERLAPAQDGGLWVFAGGRLRKWREGQWVTELLGAPKEPGATTVLLETSGDGLLVGTLKQGLYLLRRESPALHFDLKSGLSHDWVRALCEDHEGNIWVGTGGGFDGLRPRTVQMLNPPDNWRGCGVLSFSVGADGSAWIGTEGAGLYHYDGVRWTNFGESSGIRNAFIWSVLQTRGGELFAGTWGAGIVKRTGDHFDTPPALSGITSPVLSLYEGRGGEIWIGTRTGLYRYEDDKLSAIAGKEKLALPDVRAITESADGTLWMGLSGGGLGAYNGTLKQYRKGDGLGSDFILCLLADADGTLWFGTGDSGLGWLEDGKFFQAGIEQGLPCNVVSHLVDDGAGHLWLATQRGIFRVGKADLRRCAERPGSSLRFLSYGRAEGLASLSCSGGFAPGACKTTDGRLWFPTAKGVAVIDPRQVSTNPVPPPVVIEGLWAEGADLLAGAAPKTKTGSDAGPTLRIAPGKQRFELRYTALSFVAPEKVRFKYRLEGLEADWVDAGTKRSAQYSYLRPGHYTFRVTACNNDGVWNETGAALAFEVLPQFWQTWWFASGSVLCGVCVLGTGLVGVTRRRVRRRLEQLERQRALERERARIARDIHDDLGASLTRITMLSDSVRSEMDDRQQAVQDVDQIYQTARELTRALDEIVWAVNPKHDSLDSLVTYLGRFAQHFLSASSVRCRLDLPVQVPSWAVTAEVRHNVFLILKEALNNVLKHAAATEVRIALQAQSKGFLLNIADNGRGFSSTLLAGGSGPDAAAERIAAGNGLNNMRKRAEEIGGTCAWDTAPNEGTRIQLFVPIRPVVKRDDSSKAKM